jgi:uncharacterized protein (DUF433 family)
MNGHISIHPNICHGQACIKGTRIPVHQIIEMLANGNTVDDLLENYPSLQREDIVACLEYAALLSTAHITDAKGMIKGVSHVFYLDESRERQLTETFEEKGLITPILRSLRAIQEFARTADAGVYVNQICHHIQELEAASPDNPLVEVLSGLYMALVYDNLWTDYDARQFEAVRKILKTYADRPVLQPTDIEHAIMEMEAAGFNTTPIPVSAESSNE